VSRDIFGGDVQRQPVKTVKRIEALIGCRLPKRASRFASTLCATISSKTAADSVLRATALIYAIKRALHCI
jgi:hypothetical protein